MKKVALAACVVLLLAADDKVVVKEFDGEEKDINVKAGEVFRVKLRCQPSTGYFWRVEGDASFLKEVVKPMFIGDCNKEGGKADQVFVYKAAKAGKHKLTFILARAKGKPKVRLPFTVRIKK